VPNVRDERRRLGFGLVQLACFPLTLVGYAWFVLKLVLSLRHSSLSGTVLASFYTRWLQHQLGLRQDEPCARLMFVLPYISPLALLLVSGPTRLGHALTGYVPLALRYPYPGIPPMEAQPAARTTFYDAALERHRASVDQLVVLGAGLDTRCYRLPADCTLACFEVDAPVTQRFKREMLRRAGVDARRVTFVAADFERDDWLERLVAAGFEPGRPSFFLWESVTMYLDRAAVERTLGAIAGTAKGSVVAFDYFSLDLFRMRSPFWRYARAVLALIGEPFGSFGIDTTPPARAQVAAFVGGCGLTLEEHRTFGRETSQTPALAGFATALV
jgi:methyltransferase (TIGR00027 family)